mmetsp:Transcript_18401/g.52016  ORF Transcript_18401/g.52016 Transcript_18401/m.52016 type:complete len:298 (+) Transcript_18401:59-952(+)
MIPAGRRYLGETLDGSCSKCASPAQLVRPRESRLAEIWQASGGSWTPGWCGTGGESRAAARRARCRRTAIRHSQAQSLALAECLRDLLQRAPPLDSTPLSRDMLLSMRRGAAEVRSGSVQAATAARESDSVTQELSVETAAAEEEVQDESQDACAEIEKTDDMADRQEHSDTGEAQRQLAQLSTEPEGQHAVDGPEEVVCASGDAYRRPSEMQKTSDMAPGVEECETPEAVERRIDSVALRLGPEDGHWQRFQWEDLLAVSLVNAECWNMMTDFMQGKALRGLRCMSSITGSSPHAQ